MNETIQTLTTQIQDQVFTTLVDAGFDPGTAYDSSRNVDVWDDLEANPGTDQDDNLIYDSEFVETQLDMRQK